MCVEGGGIPDPNHNTIVLKILRKAMILTACMYYLQCATRAKFYNLDALLPLILIATL